MRSRIGILGCMMIGTLLASPPRSIPAHLYEEYTLGGIVPVYDWYIDNAQPEKPTVFLRSEIEELIGKAMLRQIGYYGPTDQYLYSVLDKYSSFIKGKRVAIIGSTTPWYESIILSYGGKPTTIEYNQIISEDPRCKCLTVEQFEQTPMKFDAILSISSIEHDGLGRYGDPINPWADLETMKKLQVMLEDGGLLFLSVPVGQDAIYWNAHRVYGSLRLPLLLDGWETVDSSGFSQADLRRSEYTGHQPVFVLRLLR